jgi:hypothetical protein
MNDPMEILAGAFREEWADPLESAAAVVQAIRSLAASDWSSALGHVRRFRKERADSPLLLAVTEPALDPDAHRVLAGLDEIAHRLHDTRWMRNLSARLLDRRSIGVVSLGDATLAVLETVAFEGDHDPDLVTDKLAVARGLGCLRLNVVIAPPEEVEAVLIPAAARFGNRIWTTSRAADIVSRAKTRRASVVPVLHSLNVLSPMGRRAYRPAQMLIDVEL